jgi:hypothetical protein
VQDDLKLSPEARTRVSAALSDIREFPPGPSLHRSPPSASGDDRSRKVLREMRAHETAIAGILSPAQLDRLRQIALQVRGAEALQEPEVVAALNLNGEQRAQLRSLCGPHPGRHHGPGHDSEPEATSASEIGTAANGDGERNEPPPPRGPSHRREADLQKALALLNPEQLTRWHDLTGPHFAGLDKPQRMRNHDGPPHDNVH